MHAFADLTDDEMLRAFLAHELPAAGFDHYSHLRIAWIHLQRYPLDEAIERACAGIAGFATHLGATGKFNRTLSEALMRLMAHAGAGTPGADLDAFLAANPVFLNDARSLIERHYSPERLALDAARERFLPPDRAPLPA